MKYTILITLLLELGFGQDEGKNAFADERYDEARSYYEEILLKRKNDNAAKFGLGIICQRHPAHFCKCSCHLKLSFGAPSLHLPSFSLKL